MHQLSPRGRVSRRMSGLAVLAISLIGLATDVSADDGERFAELVDEARLVGDSALALAPIIEMTHLCEWLDPAYCRDTYESLADELEDPDAKAAALYAALRIRWQSGDHDGAAALEGRLGFIQAWSYIGPFANEGMSGFRERHPIENDGVNTDAAYESEIGAVTWRQTDIVTETGYFDLSQLLYPSRTAVAFAATEIDVPRRTNAVLRVAVDGAWRAWLDGEPIAAQDRHLGGFLVRDAVPLRLTRGTHTLVIKLATDDQPMGFHARLTDRDGEALAITARPAETGGALEPTDAWPEAGTLSEVFSNELGDDATAEQAAAVAFVLRAHQSADPDQPWKAWSRRAVSEGLTGKALLRLAQVQDTHYEQMELLNRARAESSDPQILLEWAQMRSLELGQSASEDAAAALSAVLEAQPDWPRAQAMQAEMLRSAGLHHAAWRALLAAAESADWPPAACFAVIGNASTVHQEHWEADAWERLLQWRSLDTRVAGDASLALLRAGRPEAAAAAQAALDHDRQSVDPRIHTARSQLATAAGDDAGAIAALTAAIELCPGCGGYYEARGNSHLRSGNSERAIADFERALELEPQSTHLREILTDAGAAERDPFAPWRLDADTLDTLQAELPETQAGFSYVANQKVTEVYRNGLSTTWNQTSLVANTREGADQLRAYSIGYSEGAEVVEIRSVEITSPDGSTREVYESADYGPNMGPASIYFDVRTRYLYFPSLEEGDRLTLEYTHSATAERNIFDDYFGDVFFVEANQPMAFSRYVLITPSDKPISTNAAELTIGDWSEEDDGERAVRTWQARGVAEVAREAGSPGASEQFEYLSVSTYDNWDDLARWYWNLIESQLVTSDEIEETVASLTEGLTSRREVVTAIHNYVVRNTRYVGLEFGIHGFKPYRTTECFARRFGDCKDTASLIKVMLGIAGIPAHIVLTRTRDLGRIGEHPPSLAVFNHAIAYVPEFDLYLDGTAGFSGSSELPDMDQGASAVIVLDGQGGRFVTIPVLPSSASTSRREVYVDLRGSVARGEGTFVVSGAHAPMFRRAFETEDQRLEQLEANISTTVPGVRIVGAEFGDMTKIDEPARFGYEFEGGQWTNTVGGELVVMPIGRESQLNRDFSPMAAREHVLDHSSRFVTEQHVVFDVGPDRPLIDAPLGDETIESPFGHASMSVTFEDGRLSTSTSFALDVIRVAPEEYPAFQQFVMAADRLFNRRARFGQGGVQ